MTRTRPQEGFARRARPIDQIWDNIRDDLRRDTPDFKFHIWIEPLEAGGVAGRPSTAGARSTSARRSPSATCLCCGAPQPVVHRRAVVEVVGRSLAAAPRAATERFSTPPERGARPPAPQVHFDQFVIGEGNRFAHAAALAVAELPAPGLQPALSPRPPGLGKTHLLQAIGNYVQRYGAGLRVRYATIEEFTTAFVDAVRSRPTGDFKDDFRGADVVLIDDVQFLAGRTKTREEFFHTFNALLDSGRQLVSAPTAAPRAPGPRGPARRGLVGLVSSSSRRRPACAGHPR